jgi:hypothetical protein
MKTVPAGGIVTIVDSSSEGASLSDLEGSCLVKVRWGTTNALVFVADLRERGALVSGSC